MLRFVFALIAAALFAVGGLAAMNAATFDGSLGYVFLWFSFGMAALSVAIGLPAEMLRRRLE